MAKKKYILKTGMHDLGNGKYAEPGDVVEVEEAHVNYAFADKFELYHESNKGDKSEKEEDE